MSQEHAEFEVEMDFSETPAWDGEQRPLVPPGDYNVRIIDFAQKPSSKGTPMINVTFEVLDEGEHQGAKLWGNYALTEAAKGRMKQLMVAVGATLSKIISSEYLGAELTVTVVHNEGNPQPQADGSVKPARTFANVQNERAIESAPAQTTAQTKAPPVTRTAPAQNKPANNAARRA